MTSYLVLMTVPALMIFGALVGIFAYVGAGYDWAFIVYATGFALAVGAISAVTAWLEDAR